MLLRPHPLTLAVLLALPAYALSALPAHAADDDNAPRMLAPVSVSASPLAQGRDDLSTPATILEEEDLVIRRDATLGDTLDGEPGIHSSSFGRGATRPVIRGLDGARVKVVSDGSEILDASTVSPDHVITVEPALAERIEVLRGPSALRYGGGAVGGVVNVIDRKIPTAVPERGIEGSMDIRGSTGTHENTGAFGVTAGSGNFAIRAEGVKRDANEYEVGRGWSGGKRVPGSDLRSETGTLGLSWVGDRGYLGVAVTSIRSRYGLPGHDHGAEGCVPHLGENPHFDCGGDHDHDEGEAHDHGAEDAHAECIPYVDLKSQRWDLRGEYRDPFAGFSLLRVRGGLTDYRHNEVEDGAVSTTFRNKAYDGRVELEHLPIAGWRGLIGAQTLHRDFSTSGEEKYVDPTTTRNHGVFMLEEFRTGDFRYELGLRHEWQDIDVESDQPDRKHTGTSASAGVVWRFAPQYSLGASLSRTQRLPTAEELYANGPHLASHSYEIGNPDLKRETANNLDVSLRKYAGDTTFSVGAYHNRINDFIYGRTLAVHDSLQLLQYDQRNAVLTGIEGSVRQQLTGNLGGTVFGDYVRAKFDNGGGNLPRIPAYRLGMRLDATWNAWRGDAEVVWNGRQDKLAELETATPGYAVLNLGVSYQGRIGTNDYLIYLKGNNLTDKLAYNHTSFIKDAAPLAGRNLTLGARLSF